MRKLNVLKTVLDFFWLSSLLAIFALILYLPFYFLDPEMKIPVQINGQEISNQTIFSKVIICLNVISSLIFLYSIYLLRKAIILFQKREIFNNEIVRLFNLIGKSIIASSIISTFSIYTYNIIERNDLSLFLAFGSYDSFIISISLGLFFMVISEVFMIAIKMKEENDLTV
jgi:hypothetical protein